MATKNAVTPTEHDDEHSVDFDYRAMKILVFKNGEEYDSGLSVVISRRQFRHWIKFLDFLSIKLDMRAAVHRMYRLDGIEIHKFDELENNGSYVAVTHGPFIRLEYGFLRRGDDKERLRRWNCDPKIEKKEWGSLDSAESVEIYLKRCGYASITGLPYPFDEPRPPSPTVLCKRLAKSRSPEPHRNSNVATDLPKTKLDVSKLKPPDVANTISKTSDIDRTNSNELQIIDKANKKSQAIDSTDNNPSNADSVSNMSSDNSDISNKSLDMQNTNNKPPDINNTNDQSPDNNNTRSEPPDNDNTRSEPPDIDTTSSEPPGINNTSNISPDIDVSNEKPPVINDASKEPSATNIVSEKPSDNQNRNLKINNDNNEAPNGDNEKSEADANISNGEFLGNPTIPQSTDNGCTETPDVVKASSKEDQRNDIQEESNVCNKVKQPSTVKQDSDKDVQTGIKTFASNNARKCELIVKDVMKKEKAEEKKPATVNGKITSPTKSVEKLNYKPDQVYIPLVMKPGVNSNISNGSRKPTEQQNKLSNRKNLNKKTTSIQFADDPKIIEIPRLSSPENSTTTEPFVKEESSFCDEDDYSDFPPPKPMYYDPDFSDFDFL